jgi:hypothetical protein
MSPSKSNPPHLPHTSHARSRSVSFRIERWHRRAIYAVGLLLLTSGLAWLLAHYFLRVQGEFGETVHPLEHWSMQLHGGAAMLGWFFVGSLLNNHMRRAYHARRNLVTGWLMISVLAWLALSAFGLYYLAGETSRPLWSAAHWLLGLVIAPLLVLHIKLGRRSR